MIQTGFRPPFDRIPLPGFVRAGPLLAAAIAALLAASALIARGLFWPGAGLLLAGLMLDGLAASRARGGQVALLARAPFALFLPAFGFALADPSRALAAMFLVTALAILVSLQREVDDAKIMVGAGYLAACVFPNHFSIISYLVGVACFVLAGQAAARGA